MSHDIITIGASAGGVDALERVVAAFPRDFDASVFIVLHIHRDFSFLPEILSRAGPLPASQPRDRDCILPGRIYVAPPDHHLLVQRGHVHLSKGPRENRSRPAVNPLFRSAALAYGPRVIGVVLTGLLDDGTLGLWEIKRHGGIAIVQEPSDSTFSQMPENALQNVSVDYVETVDQIGPLLVSLWKQGALQPFSESQLNPAPERTSYTCPDCQGPIERLRHPGTVSEYRCRTGHVYSPRAMFDSRVDAEERALWAAVQNLEEGAELAEELSRSVSHEQALRYRAIAQDKKSRAMFIRDMITNNEPKVSPEGTEPQVPAVSNEPIV